MSYRKWDSFSPALFTVTWHITAVCIKLNTTHWEIRVTVTNPGSHFNLNQMQTAEDKLKFYKTYTAYKRIRSCSFSVWDQTCQTRWDRLKYSSHEELRSIYLFSELVFLFCKHRVWSPLIALIEMSHKTIEFTYFNCRIYRCKTK